VEEVEQHNQAMVGRDQVDQVVVGPDMVQSPQSEQPIQVVVVVGVVAQRAKAVQQVVLTVVLV
jgi:hypothetical protein